MGNAVTIQGVCYRNPLEQFMWESGLAWTGFALLIIACVFCLIILWKGK